MASIVASRYRGALTAAFAMIIAAAMAMSPAPAHADEKEDARKLLQEGDRHMRRGDQRRAQRRESRAVAYYERALDSYRKAYDLVPRSSIFFAIAEAEAKLGRHMDAITHYQRVIAEVDSDELKEQAQERIQNLRPHVAVLVVEVQPKGAEISVNGELRGVAPLGEELLLAPGDHTVTVAAEGYSPYEEKLSLEAGSESQREVALEKIPVLVKAPRPASEPGDTQTASRRTWKSKPSAGKVLVGGLATTTLIAGSTVTGLLAVSRHDTYHDAVDEDARRDARSQGRVLAIATDVLVVATVATAAYTAYQYFAVYRPEKKAYDAEQERRKDPNFWLSGYVYGRGGGLAAGGRF